MLAKATPLVDHELDEGDFDDSVMELLFVAKYPFGWLPRLPVLIDICGNMGDFAALERLLAEVVMDFIIAMVVTTS